MDVTVAAGNYTQLLTPILKASSDRTTHGEIREDRVSVHTGLRVPKPALSEQPGT